MEFTIDGGIIIKDLNNDIRVALSACGNMSAIDHPMGKVFGYMSKIEIQVPNQKGIR